jgi:hypothetical protein
MLRSLKIQGRNFGVERRLGRCQNICEDHHRWMQSNVGDWQQTR